MLSVTFVTAVLVACSVIGVVGQPDQTSRPPSSSAGCGTSTVEPGPQRDNELDVGGTTRDWAMYVPEAHDGDLPLPVWVYLHGSGGSRSEGITAVADTAEEHGFVLVSPQTLPGRKWNREEFDTEFDLSLDNPDLAFIDALIEHLDDELCIDLARVYAAGYSNGGEVATVLACVLEDRIAAAGAASAGLLDLGDDCDLSRPVPFLAIHGTADPHNPMEGGLREQPIKMKYGAERPIPDRVGAMALRNGCDPEPSTAILDVATKSWGPDTFERWTWPCATEGEVGLIVAEGMGHVWPMPNVGFDGTALMWEFFEQHSMPE